MPSPLPPFQDYLQKLSDLEDLLLPNPRFHAAVEELLSILVSIATQEPYMRHNDYVALLAATKRLQGVVIPERIL